MNVRRHAALGLMKIGEPAIDPLLKIVNGNNAYAKNEAIFALRHLGKEASNKLDIQLNHTQADSKKENKNPTC